MGRYKISRLFSKKAASGIAALTLTGIFSGCSTVDTTSTQQIDDNRMRLTKGEREFSENFFGKKNIDTSVVRKKLSEETPEKVAAIAVGKTSITFYKKYHSNDYSDRNAPYKLALFAHEMTHIWQHQNWSHAKQKAKRCHNYDYKIAPHNKFDDFCNEQQASIVQDYSRYFLTTKPVYPLRISTLNPNEDARLLKELVERTFPGAKKERLMLEKRFPELVERRLQTEKYSRKYAYSP